MLTPHQLLPLPERITEHSIDPTHLSENAVEVITGLRDAGYDAYLVGGCVRDLLLGLTPKDFDVATSATPEEVKEALPRVRLVGRRFRIAHVRAGREIIEVSTFRRSLDFDDLVDIPNRHEDDDDLDIDMGKVDPNDELFRDPRRTLREDGHKSDQGVILRDNVYGTVDEDAYRRDFTINALYYDPTDHAVIDYCDGLADIEAKTLRLIGDPETRFREDPVRILRAIRFAAKLGFSMDEATRSAIEPMSELLTAIPPARLFDEFMKMFLSGSAVSVFELMREHDLIEILFPVPPYAEPIARAALQSTDSRIAEGKPVTPGFLLAAFLWHEFLDRCDHAAAMSSNSYDQTRAANSVISEQQLTIAIPRRHALFIRDVWNLQPRLERRAPKSINKLLDHGRFRAAYDFLMLRVETKDAPTELGEWWTNLQEMDPESRTAEARSTSAPKRKRRRRRRRRPGGGGSSQDAPVSETSAS